MTLSNCLDLARSIASELSLTLSEEFLGFISDYHRDHGMEKDELLINMEIELEVPYTTLENTQAYDATFDW